MKYYKTLLKVINEDTIKKETYALFMWRKTQKLQHDNSQIDTYIQDTSNLDTIFPMCLVAERSDALVH